MCAMRHVLRHAGTREWARLATLPRDAKAQTTLLDFLKDARD